MLRIEGLRRLFYRSFSGPILGPCKSLPAHYRTTIVLLSTMGKEKKAKVRNQGNQGIFFTKEIEYLKQHLDAYHGAPSHRNGKRSVMRIIMAGYWDLFPMTDSQGAVLGLPEDSDDDSDIGNDDDVENGDDDKRELGEENTGLIGGPSEVTKGEESDKVKRTLSIARQRPTTPSELKKVSLTTIFSHTYIYTNFNGVYHALVSATRKISSTEC